MENYSLADIKAALGGEENNGVFGSNAFLWVILIFLFFMGFSGNGLFGRNDGGTVELTNLERDVLNGNCNTQKEVIDSRYTTQLGLQNLGSQMAECCCTTNRNIDAVRSDAYKNTCEIVNAIRSDGEATRALITANTIQELRDNLQSAQLQLGNISQTQQLIAALRPFPTPAYLTCSPYTSATTGVFGCGCCGSNLV